MSTQPVWSADTAEEGCPCGRPFPLRVAFVRSPEVDKFRHGRSDTFLLTCRCGRTYPCPTDPRLPSERKT